MFWTVASDIAPSLGSGVDTGNYHWQLAVGSWQLARQLLECGSLLYPLPTKEYCSLHEPTKNIVLCTILVLIVRMLNASELSTANWTKSELGGSRLGDERLRRRLIELGADLALKPAATIPKSCVTAAKIKAAYRFFDHPDMTVDQILDGHRQCAVQRMKDESIILAVQDTTTLNYATHKQTEGLGPTNRTATGGWGMLVHTTMAVTPERVALGIFDVQMWSRDPDKHGDNHKRNSKAIEDKESRKWLTSFGATEKVAAQLPNTLVVHVADREGDIYEFLAAASQAGVSALLVRMQHNRQVADCEQVLLWEHIISQPAATVLELPLPRSPGVPARRARCEIRFGQVKLKAPTLKASQPELQDIWFIEVREIGTPPGKIKPVLWRLLTTVATETLEQARLRVSWYLVRWQIEVFHRTLKTGCAVESLQLDDINKLSLAVGLKMIIAWRIMALVHCARSQPQTPASVFLRPIEIIVLLAVTKIKATAKTLTVQDAVRAIAGLAGFLGRKGDGEPGTQTLWHGLQRLDDMTLGFAALQDVGNG